MSKTIIKVYGYFSNLSNISQDFLSNLSIRPFPDEEFIFVKDNSVSISFEGLYFPLKEFLSILSKSFSDNSDGKLDYIDLENWVLERYIWDGKIFKESSRNLNNVMEYSGF